MQNRRLDEVLIFNDKLRLLIPHEWVEGQEDDPATILYSVPNTQSGWFRVSLISKEGVTSPSQTLMENFGTRDPEIDPETGNYVLRREKVTKGNGDSLHIYDWMVANSVPPSTVREAVFSYTVRADEACKNSTQQEVQLIDKLVRRAKFL